MSTKEDSNLTRWVGLLIIKNKKVLMVKEYDKDFYVLPGGRMEKGERPIDALKRELKEELGVGVKNTKEFGKYLLPDKHKGIARSFVLYTGVLIGEMVKGEEIEIIRWVDSHYKLESVQVGSVTSLKLFPELVLRKIIS